METNAYMEDPHKVKTIFQEKQKTVTDSLLYYDIESVVAMCYFYMNDVDSALHSLNSALNYCSRGHTANVSMQVLATNTYMVKAMLLTDIEQYDSAVYCYRHAIDISSDIPQTAMQTVALNINLASIYVLQTKFVESVDLYRKALHILNGIGWNDRTRIPYCNIYGDMGRVYFKIGNFEASDYYLSLVEEQIDSLPLENQRIFALNRATFYVQKKDYTNALVWRKKVYEITREFQVSHYRAMAESMLGEAYLYLNELDSAKLYLDEASEYLFNMENPMHESYLLRLFYADYYMRKKNLDMAEQILLPLESEEIAYKGSVIHRFKLMKELYEKTGNYRKAYEYAQMEYEHNDSITNIAVKNNISEIAMRYQQDTTLLKRDVLIAQKEQQVVELRTTNVIIALLLVIVFLAAVVIFYAIRRRRAVQYNQQLATINALRMENVRNRVSPHYMLNVLNSVLPSLNKSEGNIKPIQLLMQSVRGNLLVSEKMAVTLEEEIDIVKNYIALNQSMNPDAYEVKWNVATEVDVQTLLPSMIMQIPIENAIKYAFDFDDKEKKNTIAIDIFCDHNALFISIQDNGSGFDPNLYSPNSRGTGTGLKILYKTVELLNLHNHQKMKFDIKNLGDQSVELHGTIVSIEIPFDYKYEL